MMRHLPLLSNGAHSGHILAIAAIDDLIECIDFSTAYLNGEIDKDVYMHQPEGFEEGDLV